MELAALEKEIALKRQELKLLEELRELDKKIQELSIPAPAPMIGLVYTPPPWMQCAAVGHDFPQPWFGTVPPSCRRCGAPSRPFQTYIVTCGADGILIPPASGGWISPEIKYATNVDMPRDRVTFMDRGVAMGGIVNLN